MPAYNVTYRDRWVDPDKVEQSDFIQAMKRQLSRSTFERVIKTVDLAVESVKPSRKSQLVWTKAGALFGHGSEQPKKWIDHLWRNVIDVVGDDRLCLMTVGTLLLWRISLRDETWLVYNEESKNVDPLTGEKFKISKYWIDENYAPPVKNSTQSLLAKFNRHP